jgi:large subunit ribosomal protein L25
MEELVLTVEERESVGTQAAKKLRAAGRVPVNLYGPSGNRHLTVSESDFRVFWKKVKGQTTLFEIVDAKGKRTRSLVQEVQVDAMSQKAIHVDVREIAKGVEIHAHVVIHAKGEAFGVRNQGGVIEISAHDLEVRCFPRDLPHEIIVDVTELKLHDSIHIRDLKPLKGVTFLGDKDQLVLSCAVSGKLEAEESEEEEVEEED